MLRLPVRSSATTFGLSELTWYESAWPSASAPSSGTSSGAPAKSVSASGIDDVIEGAAKTHRSSSRSTRRLWKLSSGFRKEDLFEDPRNDGQSNKRRNRLDVVRDIEHKL
jgi:hypothetical protein